MKKYIIKAKNIEVLQDFEVEANSLQEAMEQFMEDWHNGAIAVSHSDLRIDSEIN